MSKRNKFLGYDTRAMEILFDRSEGTYQPESVGGVTTKTIKSGTMLEIECYPRIRQGKKSDAEAEVARRRSSPAQEKLNRKNTQKKVHRLLEANFTWNDLIIALTWDYGMLEYARINGAEIDREMEKLGLPLDEEDAKNQTRNFLRRVKRLVRKMGGNPKEFKWLYVIETGREPREEDPYPVRKYHVHLVISGEFLDRDSVENLWPYGYANIDRAKLFSGGLARIASYITKQKHGWRRWACSRNMTRPKPTVSHHKISPRKAVRLAEDVRICAKDIFGKLYPDYMLEEWPEIRYSDFVPGAYIYVRLRRRS